jgi:hypothetical protein
MVDIPNPFQQIVVQRISVKDPKGGAGASKELGGDSSKLTADEFSLDDIQEIVNDLLAFGNVRGDRFDLKYKLYVLAPTRNAAKRRARAFARAKNPFEPRVFNVVMTDKIEDIPSEGGVQPSYEVEIIVPKR